MCMKSVCWVCLPSLWKFQKYFWCVEGILTPHQQCTVSRYSRGSWQFSCCVVFPKASTKNDRFSQQNGARSCSAAQLWDAVTPQSFSWFRHWCHRDLDALSKQDMVCWLGPECLAPLKSQDNYCWTQPLLATTHTSSHHSQAWSL